MGLLAIVLTEMAVGGHGASGRERKKGWGVTEWTVGRHWSSSCLKLEPLEGVQIQTKGKWNRIA